MNDLGISASDDESEEVTTLDDNVKRMLDFSKKSPKVTFFDQVVKIPFENYFQRHDEIDIERTQDATGNSSSDEEEIQIVEGMFDNNTGHGFSSTPVEVLKLKYLDNSPDKSPRTVLVEKGSLLREKIRELEEETAMFREQNQQIIKMKQALELEKVELKTSRHDMEISLKDQKLKMEIFFKQEHEKLEQNRSKIELQAKQPSKKIKEEIKTLQGRIEELEKDLKARELKHGSSQTRLRCHIRALEKENKEHAISIEALKKENKKLEMENSRLLRQKNNKTLMEINKNIAKLASTTEENKEPADKTLTKKVPPIEPLGKIKSKPMEKHKLISNQLNNEPKWNDTSSSDSLAGDSDVESVHKSELQSGYFPTNDRVDRKRVQRENPKDVVCLNKSSDHHRNETTNEDGSKDIMYPNGNIKKVSGDGMIIKMLYFNKDIKETNVNEGTVKYYYSETKTWHTSYLDGLEILEFPR